MAKFLEVSDNHTQPSKRLMINLDAITYIHLQPRPGSKELYALRLNDTDDIHVTPQDLKRILAAIDR